MPSKTKDLEEKMKVLKGKDAEERVLDYVKKMNRPFGAVDVSANLKGAVPKTATQKILAALADENKITQKAYGKSMLFVAKQDELEDMQPDKLKALEAQCKEVDEENKVSAAEVKAINAELTKLRSAPTDAELTVQRTETDKLIAAALERLAPLRAGTSLVSAAELAQLEADWTKWRAEWAKRKKVFYSFWSLEIETKPPAEATELAADLGIEFDTSEHEAFERNPISQITGIAAKKR